ncbi:hypothetical protein [Paracoccus sp. (in: a-proteobacteria)]|uniref:hypothetical protein n=1 Tax=Paracoccus sp. TaxID=267 RepID=UPI0028978E2A|nr:hypothetical protein [Paracoccus sp. (in: a-proteobacteria)]
MTMISTTALRSLAHILPEGATLLDMARVAKWAVDEVGPPSIISAPLLECLSCARKDAPTIAQDAPVSIAPVTVLDQSAPIAEGLAKPEPAPIHPAPEAAASPNVALNWSVAEDLQLLQAILVNKQTLTDFAASSGRTEAAAKYRLRILEGKIIKRPIPEHALKWFAARRAKAKDKDKLSAATVKSVAVEAAREASSAPANPATAEKAVATELPPLTSSQAAIQRQLLAALSDDFTPEDDLYLAEELLKGTPGEMIADQLNVTAKDVAARWKKMMVEDVVAFAGAPDQRTAANLLVVLRRLAGKA